jgi:two-component system nitrogen regulation response regulator NtrX
VRELRNAVERLLILATGRTITAGDVQRLLGGGVPGEAVVVTAPSADTFEEYMLGAEKAFIAAKLELYDWNVTETARALQMPRSNLYKRIVRHGLEREPSTNE